MGYDRVWGECRRCSSKPLIGPDRLTIPAQGQTLLGKSVSDLIGTDVKVYADGTVTGTLKNVTGYTEFNSTDVNEQSGHYFPLHLTKAGTKMTLKTNGVAKSGKENMPFDSDILFRVENKNTTFTIEVDGNEVVTLNFLKAIFA